uniref:Exocyst subunit Exo70 family protein n=1 Tax=Leersia perrieri TaxID=77586 RepID=A0A0D9XA39_9ORYZ
MADGGRDSVMEVARHMGKSLAVSKNAADDIMRALSSYESGDSPLFPSSSPAMASAAEDDDDEEVFAAAEDVIRRCDSETVDYLYAAFVAVRRDALADAVAHLGGVEPVAIEEILRMEWGSLDHRMRRWTAAVRVVVRTLLAGERSLCDEVFAAAGDDDVTLGDVSFADVARGFVLTNLVGFADAVAMSTPATEKLYRMLGMYEALVDVEPDLTSLFSGDEFISGEVNAVVNHLGNTIRHTITQFVNVIQSESSRRPVNGGDIHPMTRYVLNYCGLLSESRATLDIVLAAGAVAAAESPTGGAASPSGRCMRQLLTHLLHKLDEKSQLYDDAGLTNIFLMNNLYYIVQKIMDLPSLRELLGDDWVRRHKGQIRQYETGYLRASWMAILSSLRDDGASTATATATAKEKARIFNAAFEEAYRSQTAWKVADPQLREELRIAVSERLIPAYRSFVGRARTVLESGGGSRHSSAAAVAKYIKYSLEDLEDYMLDFFEGVQKFVR